MGDWEENFLDDIINSIGKKKVDENSSVKDLAKFAKSKDKDIRQEVAEHENCTIELLELLSKDEIQYVRKTVAENPKCSKEILELLKDDEEGWVYTVALEKLVELDSNLIQELIESGNEKYLDFVLNYSETPEEKLLKVAEDCNDETLEKISKHKNIKEKSLESLFKKHKNDENFEKLARGITWNGDTPAKIIKEIYDMFKNPEDGIIFLKIMINISSNEKTPKDILVELSESEDWVVREQVAMNLSTPLETNVKLAADSSSFVIGEALKTLYERRTKPKDQLLVILKDIVGKLSATGEKIGELGGADVVSGGLMQEDVDYHTEKINSRIKELEG